MYATDYSVTPVANGVAQAPIDTKSTATTLSFTGGPGVVYTFEVSAVDVFGTGTAGTSNAVDTAGGYWETSADGGVFAFSIALPTARMGGQPLNKPVVGHGRHAPTGRGTGSSPPTAAIFTYGDAVLLRLHGAASLSTSPSSAWPPTAGGNGLLARGGRRRRSSTTATPPSSVRWAASP